MPTFDVECLDRSGSRRGAVIEAAGEEDLLEGLRGLGLYPISARRSKEEVHGITIEELREEQRQREQVVQSTLDKLQSAHERLLDGDDAAYEELCALMRIIVAEPEVYSAPMRGMWGQTLARYERAGSAAAVREQLRQRQELVNRAKGGDAKAFASLGQREVAPGWLATAQGDRPGTLCIGVQDDLVFLACDGTSGEPMSLIPLCAMGEYESSRVAGLLTKRFEITAAGGRSWTIRIDKRRMTHARRAMMQRLDKIISVERAARSAH